MLRVKIVSSAVTLGLAAVLLAGCGVADRTASQSAAVPTPVPPVATRAPSDLLYMHTGDERLALVDSLSGARERELPAGVVSPDWHILYAAEQQNGMTSLRALDLASGRTMRETQIEGAYGLPMSTPDSVMGGLSPNGRWLALTAKPDHQQTQFVVFDTAFKQQPRHVALEGSFLFDGLNNSGSSLFLTESLGDNPTASYLVRRYDLVQGMLDPKIIVEKGEEDEPMTGARKTALASKQGDWLYSLYLDSSHGPFIHALPIDDPQFAFCIDLPTDSKDDAAKQSRWSLLMRANTHTLLAVNGALGLVVEYDLLNGVPQLLRTRSLFDTSEAIGAVTAGSDSATSSIAALAPDGKMLYALGQRGLLAIDMQALTLRGRFLPDWALDGIAITPENGRLYAASAAQGKIVRLDPSAGTIAAEVPGTGLPGGLVRVAVNR